LNLEILKKEESMFKQCLKNLGLLLSLFLVTGSFSWAIEPIKVGVVDIKQCLEQSETGKKAYSRLKEKADRLQKELASQSNELKKAQEEFTRKSSLYSAETKKEKEKDLARKAEDLRDQTREKEEEFNRDQSITLENLTKDLFDLAGKIGQEEGYSLILEAKSGVLYFINSVDLTNKLIKRYNEKEKGK